MLKRFLLSATMIFAVGVSAAPADLVTLLRDWDQAGQSAEKEKDLDTALGYYAAGMAMHPSFYDIRFGSRLGERRPAPTKGKPLLGNQPESGSTIYVYSEEGYGDTIQFSRYLTMLVNDGYDVVFRPQPALAGLMGKSFDQITIDTNTPESDLDFDYHVSLLSLPHYYFGGVPAIPGRGGYLAAGEKEPLAGQGIKVGIVWQGFPGRYNDRNRSLPLEELAGALNMPGVQLYLLQVGEGREQIEELRDQVSFVDLGEAFESFSDTAAAVAQLDLVVSVDTSVAHLAGAVGVPAWILIPNPPDWRWLIKGKKSIWYDSVELYRQETVGEWEPVLKAVKVDLSGKVG